MNAIASHCHVLGGLLLALLTHLPAQANVAASITTQLQLTMKEHQIPGLSCAVVAKDELIYAQGFGVSDLENDVAATDATVYRLASISKPITAVLVMQLVEQGKLDLDADVSSIVPEWPAKRWPVTSRLLLAHLGGVRHYKRFKVESTQRYPSQVASLKRFAADDLLHEPGSKYLYSTFGFNLLAAVVETGCGETFAAVVKQRIATPSGAATLQDDDQRRLIKGRAQGYTKRGEELQNSKLMDSSYKLGGGGLCSSAPDLARFAQALMAGRLLRAETLQAMWTEQQTRDGKPVGYGLGFGVRQLGDKRVIEHSGAQSRVSTMLCMLPDEQIAVVIMCNLEGMRFGSLARELAMLVSQDAQTGDAKPQRSGGKQ